MPELGPVAWPPAPIRTERLVLRELEARDRAAFIELLASPGVGTYLGGRVTSSSARCRGRPSSAPGLFLAQAWGFGYALEACAAALDWLAGELPCEPVVLFTQTANARSMRLAAKLGFTEAERFEAWDAEQWFGLRPPVTPSG
jgi:RimJ/RimL family protein N-acetyltransferase